MRKITEEDFETKYYEYKDTIYSIAFNYVHNKSDAEDITQDVFMKYLSSNEEFKEDENEKFWLIRVAINTSISLVKSKWRTKVSFDNEYIAQLKDDNIVDNDVIHMRTIISSLKDKYKEIIILYYYENYSISDIAQILKISIPACKKRLERARELIRREY